MKIIKLLLLSTLLSCFSSLYAQGDDWQTGGGATSPTHSYDNYNSNRGTRNSYLGTDYDYSSSSSNLWNGGFEDLPLAVTVGYVNKQWISKWNGKTRRENMFLQEGKRLHGMQFGMQYTPCLPFGLGLKTGLYYEMYISESSAVKDKGWDQFTEHDLYIPLQAVYRFPLGYNGSISIFGGIAMQWAMAGEYGERGEAYYDYYGDVHYYSGAHEYQQYGNGWPKRLNWQAEGGINVRIKQFTCGFTYSFGLTNHKFYNECKTRQDKMAFNLGIAF